MEATPMSMPYTPWRRITAIVGILAVVLFLVGAFVFPSRPDTSDATETIVSYYQQNREAILAGTIVSAWDALLLLLFVIGIRPALGAGEERDGAVGGLILAAGAIVVGLTLASAAASGAAAYQVVKLNDAGAIRVLNDFGTGLFLYSTIPYAAFVGACSVLALRTRALPRWLAWGGFVPVIAFLIGTFDYVTTWAGAFVFIGLLLFVLWVLGTSIALLRR